MVENSTARPALHRTPSVMLIESLCHDVDHRAAPSEERVDAFLHSDDENVVLQRGQRLNTLASQLAPEAPKAAVKAAIQRALTRQSPRFAKADKVTENGFRYLVEASTNRAMAVADVLEVASSFDKEVVRQEVQAAAEPFKLTATLLYAQALSLCSLETLADGLLTRFSTNAPKIFARIPDWIEASHAAADGGHPAPSRETERSRRVMAFLRRSAGEENWAAFEAMGKPQPGDDAVTTLFKQHIAARVSSAMGALLSDADVARLEAFYASADGKRYLESLADIQAPYAAELTQAVEAVCERYKSAIKAAAERRDQAARDEQEREMDTMQEFLDGLRRQTEDLIALLQRELDSRKGS